ncbi:hypothetical protein [Actinomadura barringtoniae]|nr:hypothetical protein [Actinomadura barringtoniae]
MKAPAVTSTQGRGIFIVDQLVESWTVESLAEGGKLVRVTMAAPS